MFENLSFRLRLALRVSIRVSITYCKSLISFGDSVIWHQSLDLFGVAETGGGIIQCGLYREQNEDLDRNINGRTEGTDPGVSIGV
jgi:hypothetical protein